MRSYVALAALAAAFVLAPMAAGDAPALSQDFSITNPVPPEPADAGRRDVMKQLQAWWDVHAYYPKDASANDLGGTVKVRLVIHPDGNVWTADTVESAGSRVLDMAGAAVFRGAFVRPFPQGAPAASIDLSLHYVLTHRHDQPVAAGDKPALSKIPFTISNDPVKPIVVDTMLQRTCTGFVVKEGLRNHPAYGWRLMATAIFFRKPDGTPWVKFWTPAYNMVAPVTEVGNLAQWTTGPEYGAKYTTFYTRYTVWPDGDNHLIGDIAGPQGTVELTCASERVPPITSNGWLESPTITRSDDLKP